MTGIWFSPAPSEITVSRISLDFGLRSADLFFRELVVPDLGRVWFVRQISWPVAALALHEELRSSGSRPPRPTAICHGIEALACKLEYVPERENRSTRLLGTRAFGRDVDSEVWTFNRLRQPTNYVRNTHRQAASRALRTEGGLGFATGPRFDLLELSKVGEQLADAFLKQPVGQGRTSLRKWLVGWINDEHEVGSSHNSLLAALSPEKITPDERDIVKRRLLDTTERPQTEKRVHLARALGRAAGAPDAERIEEMVVPRLRQEGHEKQAGEIVAALAFGFMLDRARDAVANLTRAVEPGRGGVKLATLGSDSTLRKSIRDLRSAATNYMEKANTATVKEATSRSFADAALAADDSEMIRLLVRRAGEILGLADGSVIRGPLFRIVIATDKTSDLEDGAESIEPDRTGRTFRIANLHSLLRDVDQRGAR